MRVVTMLWLAAGLTGCYHWRYTPPEGHTQTHMYADSANCRAQANVTVLGVDPRAAGRLRQDAYVYCLRGKGWTVERVKK